jgi:BlaI family transcriptional regulator, penicillinase repressor
MNTKRLLASELEILDVLWTQGPLSIVEVQRALTGAPAYTSVQTRLNRMLEKGLLERSEGRPAKYSPAIARKSVAARDLKLLVNNVSDGQIVPLVAQLVNQRTLSQKELDEIRAIIEHAENRVRNKKGKLE